MPPDVVMGAVLLAGAAACAAAAAQAGRGEPARLALAAALAFGGAGVLVGGGERDQLEIAASALGAFGVILLVLERSGTVTRLSWLDAVMGATSSAAVAVVFDASAPTALALAGAMAGLALSRWRPDPPVLLAAAGVAALGAGWVGALAAAPTLGLAAWLRTGRPAAGPEFNPVVLCAILAFATTALALLTFGQFETVDDVAVVLAGVTVLAGMGRAGLTVTERLAESDRRAITDDLTGLSNRRHLVEALETAVDAAADARDELALLVVDLDGFKELNDTLGHHAGDEVLRQIGPRLRPLLRERDTLARLGGDEFAVILVPGDEAAASTAGLRLRAALERSFEVGDIRVHVDASVGIALFPQHAPTRSASCSAPTWPCTRPSGCARATRSTCRRATITAGAGSR